ncbi:MAG TPA: hypothetical protein VFY65_05700 [Longimicrobium sp.]|nr:hypothetical protein [Longimicrobium sp.]
MTKQSSSEPVVDRTTFAVFASFEEADAHDDAYWRSRAPAERLAYLEYLRRMKYGDAATGRMEKVFEIGWLPRRTDEGR